MTERKSTATRKDLPVMAVEGLQVDFEGALGRVPAVKGLSFDIRAGETLAILGESGSGKSVTADAIMGLIACPPGHIRAGRILYRGRDLLAMPEAERRAILGRHISMIYQDPLAALNPVYPVGWQIEEIFRIHGVGGKRDGTRAIKLLEEVGLANPAMRVLQYPHQFSGGQRQRIVIAMAVALEPELLIADEPTTALDVTVQARILKLLKRIQRRTGTALIIITHDLGVAANLADKVVVMHDGEIVERGTVDEVFRRPRHWYTKRLLASVPGRGIPTPRSQEGEVLMKADNLVKEFPVHGRRGESSIRAVDDVSLVLRRGECLGVVGESGSGKTTLARLLLRLDQPAAGRIAYKGTDLAGMTPAEVFAFRRQMQVVFQDPNASLNPFMKVGEIIAEPWAVHGDVVPRSERGQRVGELLERVGLKAAHAARYPHQFSGGQRQRIAIARALALQPEIIVCDEAVSALDVSIQAQIIELLKDLRREHRFSCLFIAHDLGVVRELCDRVVVMQRGRIVEEAATPDLFERPAHSYTRELLDACLSIPEGTKSWQRQLEPDGQAPPGGRT